MNAQKEVEESSALQDLSIAAYSSNCAGPTMAATSLTTAFTATSTSNMTNSTSLSCEMNQVPSHPLFISAYCLVSLISLAMNTITMRVYFCTSRRLQSSVTIYLKNLAAADFFICLCLPLRIAKYASKSLTMRNIYCNFGATAFYLNMYASILFMDYIAVNRYLKIVHPLETHPLQTPRAARNISIVTWVCMSTMACIFLFLSTSWSVESQRLTALGCDAISSPKLSLLHKITHSISATIFIFVLVSLVFFYCGTVRSLRQTEQGQGRPCNPKLRKSKRNMLVLVVVFCVCFVPYHLVRLPYVFLKPLKNCSTAHAFYTVKELTVLLSVLNACLDPLIYFFFCKAFRAQLSLRKYQATSSWQLTEAPGETRKTSNEDSKGFSTPRRQSVF
ncbi:P2Y purinoceptor 14 [Astyanax mexicanus]|uniref:P2Y purinoceptor 14 n=1 Tax=Astyanax mexicanus TaxID=7994 RepID=UPI0020CAD470|nr:P2Y purinoceptor 14 [Astyanax mexicanus]